MIEFVHFGGSRMNGSMHLCLVFLIASSAGCISTNEVIRSTDGTLWPGIESDPHVPPVFRDKKDDYAAEAQVCVALMFRDRNADKQCYQTNTAMKVIQIVSTLGATIMAVAAAQIDDTNSSTHTARQGLVGASLAAAGLFAAASAVDIWSNCSARSFALQQVLAVRSAHLQNAAHLMACTEAAEKEEKQRAKLAVSKQKVIEMIEKTDPTWARRVEQAPSKKQLLVVLGGLIEHMQQRPAKANEESTPKPAEKKMGKKPTPSKTPEASATEADQSAAAADHGHTPSEVADVTDLAQNVAETSPSSSNAITVNAVSCTTTNSDGDTEMLPSLVLRERAHQELIACHDMDRVPYGASPTGPKN